MIIKSRGAQPAQARRRRTSSESATSIDEEVARLNRVVTDVLDFARPIRFDLAPADLGEICRDAAQAAQAGPDDVPVELDAAGGAPIVTDAERLRAVLVNVLTNAQQAVRRAAGDRAAGAADPAARRRATAGPVAHRGRRPRARHRAGRPAAPLRAVLHDAARRAPASAWPSPATSSKGWAARSRVESRPDVGTTVRIELPDRACGRRHARDARIRSARRRRAEDPAGAGRGAARRRPRRHRRPAARARRCGSSASGRSTCWSSTTSCPS